MFKLLISATAIFATLTGAALAAGNFAFAVPAEQGLTLEITGYGPDGAKLFDQTADSRQDQDGTQSYVVTVDEGIILAARPAKWCVRVTSGQSALIPGSGRLCDLNPSAVAGIYTFKFGAHGETSDQAGAPEQSNASHGFQFDIAPDVPADQVATIKEALAIAQAYMDKALGGGIPPEATDNITVKIEATGKGNQEPGGGGAAATGLSESGPRPYFDVKHPQWNQDSRGRGWTTETDNMKTVIHEYTHSWQSWLGAMTIHSQPLGNWMDEGIAEYVAYRALADAGKLTKKNADKFELQGAIGAETSKPLDQFAGTQTSAWPGHVGYLAIDWLVSGSPHGMLSLRIIAEQIAAKKSVPDAFAAAFGLQLSDFYSQFETWRLALVKDPARAFQRRPHLVLSQTAAAPSDDAAPRCVQGALKSLGYDVKTVDGKVGAGTLKAFAKYQETSGGPTGLPLDDAHMLGWCLFMAAHAAVDDATKAVATDLGAKTSVDVYLQASPDQIAQVNLQDATGAQFGASSTFEQVTIQGRQELLASFPYNQVKPATQVCVYFTKPWMVKDQQGKLYGGSCNPIAMEFLTTDQLSFSYKLAKQ